MSIIRSVFCSALICMHLVVSAAPRPARMSPVVEAVQTVLPSVVNIATERVVRVSDPFEAFFRDYFGGEPGSVRYFKQLIPLGSGIIISHEGLILTNLHVVRRASTIEVRLHNGNAYPATPIAFDAGNDLALLRLKDGSFAPSELHKISFARPADLLLGETVIAVGNPFGLESTVTTGVLSAKNRTFQEGDIEFDDILQTDAAVNPGNSGGPLINVDGDLIGINLAIRRGAEGIGFAIPLQRIGDVLSRWLIPAKFSNAMAGFVPRTEISEAGDIQVAVASVVPGSPAAAAGLKEGQIIRTLNQKRVTQALDAAAHLWRLRLGDSVKLRLASGRDVEFDLAPMTSDQLIRQRLGIQVQHLTPALRKALELPPSLEGLAISEVLEGSALGGSTIQRGDIILRIGDVSLTKPEELATFLERDTVVGGSVELHLVAARRLYGEVFLKQLRTRVIVQ